VHTLNEARRVLQDRHDIDLVLITVNFDESRMFDLLRLCTAKYPDIVVVCCRIFEQDVSKISIEAMRIASEALNAAGFIEFRPYRREEETVCQPNFGRLSSAIYPSSQRTAKEPDCQRFLRAEGPPMAKSGPKLI
jgi:hypothetical protein